MTENSINGESIQEAFDASETDELREVRKHVGEDLIHLGLSESTREVVDLTLFVSNAGQSDLPKTTWEIPSKAIKPAAIEIAALTKAEGELIQAELTLAAIYTGSLLRNETTVESQALPDDVRSRLEQHTLPAITLALNHFHK